jgi:hypothetical protein
MHLKDVASMMTEYCFRVRELGIPLADRFIGEIMLHPHVSAHVWKWDEGTEFERHGIASRR